MDQAAHGDERLIQEILAGDQAAACQLMDRLHPLVVKIVRSHLPRRMSEEDLMQTVFMKVFSKLDQFSGAVPLEHWVSRVAVNSCLNQIQSERIRPEVRMADLGEEEAEVVERLLSSKEEIPPASALAARELVEKLMSKLSPQDRLILTFLHLDGKSVLEVQRETGWSSSLIKVRAFRARLKLRRYLNQLTEGERI